MTAQQGIQSMDMLSYDTVMEAVRAGLPGWMECRASENDVIKIMDYQTRKEWTLFSSPRDTEDWSYVHSADPVQMSKLYAIECGVDLREIYPSDLIILDQILDPPEDTSDECPQCGGSGGGPDPETYCPQCSGRGVTS